jgi:hypothetical protein
MGKAAFCQSPGKLRREKTLSRTGMGDFRRRFLLKGLTEAKDHKTLNRKGNPPRRMPDPVPGAMSGKISLDKFRNAVSVE